MDVKHSESHERFKQKLIEVFSVIVSDLLALLLDQAPIPLVLLLILVS